MTRPALCLVLVLTSMSLACLPGAARIDARVRAAMAETRANGLAIAVIDDGRVTYVQAYGTRNAKGDPLQTDTVMYGASLTKTVMAYTTLTLVDQGKLDLDAPLADYLERPLDQLRRGRGASGEVRALSRPRRRRTLAHHHGAHGVDPLHRFPQLLVHRSPTRSCASTSIPVHATATRAKASACCSSPSSREPTTKGLGLDVKDADRRHLRAAGHDAHQPAMAPGLPAESGRRVERQGRAGGA